MVKGRLSSYAVMLHQYSRRTVRHLRASSAVPHAAVRRLRPSSAVRRSGLSLHIDAVLHSPPYMRLQSSSAAASSAVFQLRVHSPVGLIVRDLQFRGPPIVIRCTSKLAFFWGFGVGSSGGDGHGDEHVGTGGYGYYWEKCCYSGVT
ncbi:uncharacterized protein G2W53_039639 [Senna tora]|uniref:Uncharacterized protein n=1 Tax=Senna tora TaxID=362788 RepID=A0A834SQW6_9FABA|nr:uncharacterized protein G2W53_039639 [Senna tora]